LFSGLPTVRDPRFSQTWVAFETCKPWFLATVHTTLHQ
jgi:hypothetical protein